MKLPDDLELLELLNSHEVRYLIVGAQAVAFGGLSSHDRRKPWSLGKPVRPATNERSVVVDDVTSEVIHVGGDGFLSK